MVNRILIYAAVYGGIGVVVGVLMAFYTADAAAVMPVAKTVELPTEPAAEPVPDEEEE